MSLVAPLRDTEMPARCRALLVVALTLAASSAAAQPDYDRRRSTVERFELDRLAAVGQDVERLHKMRRELSPLPGLVDYRAIFHAHAGDSAHTGGSLPEILEQAKLADVDVIFLSDHFRPPRDFMDGWRGMRDGVLFVPGSEARGYLLYPEASIFDVMEAEPERLLARATQGSGLAFLSHVEERVDHAMDRLTGMEIYNRHADADDDRASMVALLGWVTDPDGIAHLNEALRLYPDAFFAAQLDYPELYLGKWDRETQTRRVVGVAANDCHHNQVFLVKKIDERSVRVGTIVDADDEMRVMTADQRPRIPELVAGLEPGAVVARFDFDPYERAMRNTSTHVLAPELSESAIRAAVAAGHVYVSHDWMADPTGFRFLAQTPAGRRLLMGDEATFGDGIRLLVELPLPAMLRLVRDGAVIAEASGSLVELPVEQSGVYRVEAWLELDGEKRLWILSNPIYLRERG